MMQENLFPPSAQATVDPLDALGGKPSELLPCHTDETAVALDVATKGLADIIAKRIEQAVRFGHTPDQDAMLPLRFFALELQALGQQIADDSTFALKLALMRRHVVKMGALALATLDRIDVEIAKQDAADDVVF